MNWWDEYLSQEEKNFQTALWEQDRPWVQDQPYEPPPEEPIHWERFVQPMQFPEGTDRRPMLEAAQAYKPPAPTAEQIEQAKRGQKLQFAMDTVEQEFEDPNSGLGSGSERTAEKWIVGKIPFVHSAYDLIKSGTAAAAAKRIKDGTPEEMDYVTVARYMVQNKHNAELDQNQGWLVDVADMLTSSLTFGAEFLATGGAATAIGERAGVKLGGELAEGVAKSFGRRAVEGSVAAGAQVLMDPASLGAKTAELTAQDNVEALFTEGNESQSFLQNLPEGLIRRWTEMSSERTGGAIGEMIAKVPLPKRIEALKRAIFSRFETEGKATEFLRRSGFAGTTPEVLENRVQEVMDATLDSAMGKEDPWSGVTLPTSKEGINQILKEYVAFLPFSAAGATINKLTKDDAARRKYLQSLSAEQIEIWKKEAPSRRDAAEAGIYEPSGAEERKGLAKAIQETLEETDLDPYFASQESVAPAALPASSTEVVASATEPGVAAEQVVNKQAQFPAENTGGDLNNVSTIVENPPLSPVAQKQAEITQQAEEVASLARKYRRGGYTLKAAYAKLPEGMISEEDFASVWNQTKPGKVEEVEPKREHAFPHDEPAEISAPSASRFMKSVAEKATEALQGIDTSTVSGERKAMQAVAKVAKKHGLRPNALWREVYWERDGASRDIEEILKKPEPKVEPVSPEIASEARIQPEAAEAEFGQKALPIKRRVGAAKKRPGKPISKNTIQKTFPGAKITEAPKGYHVEVGDSFFTIQVTDQMPEIDWDAAEVSIGRRVSPKEREQIQAAGATSLEFPDGTKHDGLGLILLNESLADDAVLRHEALHLARQAGIIGPSEWDALVKEHARGATDPNVQEERIAQAMEAVEAETSIWSRIKSWIRRMLSNLGITDYQARDIHQLLQSSGFWARAGKPSQKQTRYALDFDSQRFPYVQYVRVEFNKTTSGMGAGEFFYDAVKGLNSGHALYLAKLNWPGATVTKANKAEFDLFDDAEEAGLKQNVEGMRYGGINRFGIRYALRGRPDLANPAIDEDARRMVDDVDEARNQMGLPETRADEDVEREANERLEKDYDGERSKLVEAGQNGKQLLDVDTIIAKKIINREASEALQSGEQQRISEAMAVIEAYRNTGSEQGRAFRQRKDPVETPAERMARMISEAILEPPEKKREQRNKARREGRHEQADKINQNWSKEVPGLKEKLKLLGVDIDNLWEQGYSRKRAAKVISTIKHAKASGWDKAYEYWRNSILSLPTTQAANVIGNIGHAGWHFTAERFTEALVNTVASRPEGAQLGEFKHMLAGMLPGMSQGARNFLTTWNTETPTFEATIGREGQWKIEDPHTAIGGKHGRAIRWPQRLLLAVDDFSKTLFTQMEVGANAYRIAKAEGLEGEALSKRMQELTLNVESPAWDSAYDSALELTFQQKGSETLQKVKRNVLSARRDLPGLRYILPFVTTPINIFSTGIKKSPLGALRIPLKMYRNHKEGRHVLHGLPADIAQQVIAWGLVLALLGNDEDDPWITGSEPESNFQKREVSYRTAPAMSVKIGDKWYSYSRLEPFATAIGLTVDFVNAIRSGNTKRQVETPLTSLKGQIGSKTFLSGVGDILDAVQEEEPSRGIAQWASNFATSWVPNLVRGSGREASDYYENRRVWGTRGDWFKRLGRRTLQKTELPTGIPEYPLYDVWGRPGKRSQTGLGPATDWLYRITVPIRIQKDETFKADRLIINYNNHNPEDERFPLAPRPFYRSKGKTIYMTEGQYAELSRLGGEAARASLDGIKFDVEKPTKEAVEWINDAVSEARSAVRANLEKRWAGEKVDIDSDKIGKQVQRNMLQSVAGNVQYKKRSKQSVEDFKESQVQTKQTLKTLGITLQEAEKLLQEYFDEQGGIMGKNGDLKPSYLSKLGALRKMFH